jgi:hypothetical protein
MRHSTRNWIGNRELHCGTCVDGAMSIWSDYITPKYDVEETQDAKTNILNGDDYGPQRWSLNGDKLYETNDENVWVDSDGEIYYVDFDEVIASDPAFFDARNVEVEKVRTELTPDEQSWLDHHEQFLPQIDSNEENDLPLFDEVSHEGLETAEFSSDATELSKEQINFWTRYVYLLRVSIKSAYNLVCKTNTLTDEERDYALELCSDEPTNCKQRKFIVMRNSGRTYRRTTRDQMVKKVHMHIYVPTDNIPEGFVIMWANCGNHIEEISQYCFSTKTECIEHMNRFMADHQEFQKVTVNMSEAWKNITGRAPIYKKVHTLMNEPTKYIEATTKVLALS